MRDNKQRGFTLPELLVSGAIIIILLATTLVVMRPKNYDVAQRDASRRLDLAAVMQAVVAYKAKNGTLPESITTEELIMGSEATESDICLDLVPTYIKDLPLDPIAGGKDSLHSCIDQGASYTTGYSIRKTAEGTVTLAAPLTERGKEITISRKF